MTIKVQTPDGGTAHFPDGTDAATIETSINAAFPPEPEGATIADTGIDVAKSAGIGTVKGTIGLAGLPALAGSWLGDKRDEYIANPISRALGLPEAPVGKPSVVDVAKPASIQGAIEDVTGKFYEPKTKAGKHAETVGEFAPMALAGPGGIARKMLTYAVAPGVASEAAGQYAEGTPWEGAARIGGALAGGVGGILGGKAVSGASNYLATKSAADEIGGILNQPNISPGAVRRVSQSIGDDALTPAVARTRAAELGDDAMLLDMGRQMGGRAEAIAAQPGRGQNKVLDAVEQRTGQFGEKTAERIKETLDKFVGPSPNIVETQKRVDQVVDALATPQYKRVMSQHPVVWDDALATLAERPVIRQGLKDAVSLAKNYGEDAVNLGKLADDGVKPSLQYWDYVKKSIDHRINARMEKGGLETLNGKEKADLGGLMDAKKALTDYLDQITNGEYALARKLSSTKFEVREAGEVGRKAFQNNLLPEEFAARIADMTLPEQTMAKAQMRREIERVIDTARNDGAAARRFLDTTQNGQKIEAIFGKNVLTEIEKRLAAETQFQTIKGKVADNSRTAVRGELIKDTAETSVGNAQGTTLTGLVHAGARGGLNYVRNNGLSRTREGIADLLTTKGDDMHRLIEVMSGLAEKRALNSSRAPSSLPLSLAPNSLSQARK
jgi:hypothetical protein